MRERINQLRASHLLTFAGLAGLFIVMGVFTATPVADAGGSTTSRSGKHILTIYDGGREIGVLTDADTLEQALDDAHIPLEANDITEPARSEKLVAANYNVNIYRARPVVIEDESVKTRIMTAYRTPTQIAKQAGIALQKEDLATMKRSNDLIGHGASEVMTIERATPFTFVFYGKSSTSYTRAATVGEMLEDKDITLGPNDGLSVPRDTPITAGMTVSLWRNGKQTITQEEDVKFPTEQIKDANREVGFKEVKTPGVNGKKNVTYEIEMRDGVEVARKEINSVTTKEPVKQVEIVGTKFSNTFSGSFAEALARLRSCEGSYTSNTGNGYYGAYQYDLQTWGNYQGYANASLAPPAVQDQKVWETYQRRGWQPWPSCSRSLGLQDIYR